MPAADSLDKVVGGYLAAVCARPFTFRGQRHTPERLRVPPEIIQGFTCPPGCGGCCPTFTLDYLPHEPHPYPLEERTVEVDGRSVTVHSDTQADRRSEPRCRNLQHHDGRCAIHGRQPFSCDFELLATERIAPQHGGGWRLTTRLFRRGWAMRRTDGGVGNACELTRPTLDDVADVDRRLARLEEWAAHFGIPTRLPIVRDWIEAVADDALAGRRVDPLELHEVIHR